MARAFVFFVSFVLISAPAVALAQTFESIGIRAQGMGGAFVAVADDASALYWNAAGIARIASDKSELQFNHAVWIADTKFTQAGYVFHLKKIPGAKLSSHTESTVEYGGVTPGIDPSTYAFVKWTVHRNLYRIPIP